MEFKIIRYRDIDFNKWRIINDDYGVEINGKRFYPIESKQKPLKVFYFAYLNKQFGNDDLIVTQEYDSLLNPWFYRYKDNELDELSFIDNK